ncbi:putative nucleic acid-binding Zn ribbon protein [Haloferula luteola]|uniref:Putative nucleic acid-binding Zn ribbon protein n=1 Tax=Haloferula luteola TaxID=595692 RepID=A0A840UZR0_9BACT|nr:zinc ribbon domain-containing protein [Haloferula luteola]MBB5350316.1 putative nucleic acid-binding Zn ribbon protein [Haloferula luteola]
MPIYLYETLSGATTNEATRRFEVKQSIHDAPLTHDPETGFPVRRVITGGLGYLKGPSTAPPHPSHRGGCCGNC